jgi:hypothetical protein
MKKITLLLCIPLFSISCIAQGITDSMSLKSIKIFPDKILWMDAKPPLPPGAKVAVLEGDPKKEGVFTMRLKFPAHYILPAHLHPKDERVTVLSGSVNVGFGDKLDEKNATHYTAGCFYVNPAGSHHYIFTGNEEVVVQLTGIGPWGIQFLEEKK